MNFECNLGSDQLVEISENCNLEILSNYSLF